MPGLDSTCSLYLSLNCAVWLKVLNTVFPHAESGKMAKTSVGAASFEIFRVSSAMYMANCLDMLG